MTRKLSLITAVGVAALSVGAPAAFGSVHANAEVAPVLAQPNPMIEDGFAQAVAQVRGTGFRDAHESAVASEPGWLKALRIRGEGMDKLYGLGEYATTATISDSLDRFAPSRGSQPVSATASGNDVEWPQVGAGLGIGLLLALGFGLIMRTVHIRPFAH